MELLVYVGTYTEPIRFGTGKILEGKGRGIHVFSFDAETGALRPRGEPTVTKNPSYLAFHPHGGFLYAVNELKSYESRASGSLSAFAVEAGTGALRFLNSQPTLGTDPCHVVVDPEGGHALVANFMSGSVCVLPILPDGSLGEASDFRQHHGSSADPVRQSGPHAHAVTLDEAGSFAFVPDLGLDRLVIYAYDGRCGKLTEQVGCGVQAKPGAGPRHLVMHPRGPFAYLINELDSTVSALAYEAGQGRFRHLQTLSTLPEGYSGASTCADLQVSPLGDLLLASNRGHDSIAVFRIDAGTGRLQPAGHCFTEGKTPRNFALAPGGRFLLAANQDSDTIVTFRLDVRRAALEPAGQVAKVGTPVCVKFLPGA